MTKKVREFIQSTMDELKSIKKETQELEDLIIFADFKFEHDYTTISDTLRAVRGAMQELEDSLRLFRHGLRT